MKILYILDFYYPHIGGVETLFQRLAEYMAAQGHEVTLITRRLNGYAPREIINGVHIQRVRADNRPLFLISGLITGVRYARNVDLIHSSTYVAGFLTWMIGKITRTQTILTVHEVWGNNWRRYTNLSAWRSLLYSYLEKFYYLFKHDQYVVVSESTKKQLNEMEIVENVLRIYNAVDYEHFSRSKHIESSKKLRNTLLPAKKTKLYLSFGRPGISKGFERLPGMCGEVRRALPNAFFVLICSNSPSTRKERERIIDELDRRCRNDYLLLDSVDYNDLPSYILAADCIVVPSRAEGFGLAVAEVCALGQPIVAANTTAIPEVISGRYLLCSADELASTVIHALRHNIPKKEAKRFEWSESLKQYEGLYDKLCE